MKRLIFCLAVVGFCCSSCSEKEGSLPTLIDKRVDTFLTSYMAEIGGDFIDVKGFYLVTGFDKTDECLLTEETYASFKMLLGGELRFVGEHASEDGVLHMKDGNVPLFSHAPWRPSWVVSEHDYYQLLPVAASGAGTFVFEIEFYQPLTNERFVTRPYMLILRWENGTMVSEMRFVEDL